MEYAWGQTRKASGPPTLTPHAGPALTDAALLRMAKLARGAAWATGEPGPLFGELRRRLSSAHGPEPGAEEVVHLQRLATAALGTPRPRSLDELGAALGIATIAPEHPLGRARLAADCLVRLLEYPVLARVRSLSELDALPKLARAAAPDLSGKAFDEAALRALPPGPGIYRFFDRDERLLYVGKSRTLRRRVSSYFAARRDPDPRTAPWLPLVHRMEVEESGSEVEALLREAELIARASPPGNTQRLVHERRRSSTRDLVLVLAAARPKMVRTYLICDGAIAARVLLGPRGGGQGRLLRLLEELYFSSPRQDERRPSTAEGSRSRALLASWFARQPGTVPAFDPTDAATARAALALALRYAQSIRDGERDVIHR